MDIEKLQDIYDLMVKYEKMKWLFGVSEETRNFLLNVKITEAKEQVITNDASERMVFTLHGWHEEKKILIIYDELKGKNRRTTFSLVFIIEEKRVMRYSRSFLLPNFTLNKHDDIAKLENYFNLLIEFMRLLIPKYTKYNLQR